MSSPAAPGHHNLHGPSSADSHTVTPAHQSFWLWVLCLTGVDYFSTLAYQPSIAITSAGRLAPVATILLVLTLLGFAATDFVITITLSAADAAKHLMENPLFHHVPSFFHSQIGITLAMIMALGALFLKGVREVIGVAVVIVAVYLAMNLIVLSGGLVTLVQQPHYVSDWWDKLSSGDVGIDGHSSDHEPAHGNENEVSTHADAAGASSLIPLTWYSGLFMSALLFPKLALGLSGFETGVAVMPQIRGEATDTEDHPAGRIKRTQWLLKTSALIMSVC